MAKIRFGAVVTDSRGHIGGIAYQWTRFGNVARRLVTPTRATSPRATLARSRFASLSKRWWSHLTPTQRTAWRALAAANPRPNVWGDEFPLTGHQLYVGINMLFLQGSYPITDTAPADQAVTGLTLLTLSAVAPDQITLTFAPSPLPANHVMFVTGRANLSPGITNTGSRRQYIDTTIELATSPLALGAPFVATLGNAIATRQQVIASALFNITNGALSASVTSTAITT